MSPRRGGHEARRCGQPWPPPACHPPAGMQPQSTRAPAWHRPPGSSRRFGSAAPTTHHEAGPPMARPARPPADAQLVVEVRDLQLARGAGGGLDRDQPQQLELLELDLQWWQRRQWRGGSEEKGGRGRKPERALPSARHPAARGTGARAAGWQNATTPSTGSHARQQRRRPHRELALTLRSLSGMSSAETWLKSGGPSLLRARSVVASAAAGPEGGAGAWSSSAPATGRSVAEQNASCTRVGTRQRPRQRRGRAGEACSAPRSKRTDDLVDGAGGAQEGGLAGAQDRVAGGVQQLPLPVQQLCVGGGREQRWWRREGCGRRARAASRGRHGRCRLRARSASSGRSPARASYLHTSP